MTNENNGGSINENTTPVDSERPGERVNEITPTNAPKPAPDPSKNDAVREPERATEDNERADHGPQEGT